MKNFTKILKAINNPSLVFFVIKYNIHVWKVRYYLSRKNRQVLQLVNPDLNKDLLNYYRNRANINFFVDLEITSDINNTNELIQSADKICNHQFDLLGSGMINLGKIINWHQDFKSGKKWPLAPITDIKYGSGDGSDIKVPWELSRFQHLPTLGQAYLITKDEKYAEEFISQISNWIASNPVYNGPNWKNAMEAAIRASNMICGWYFFKDSNLITNNFFESFLTSLQEHGNYIYNNLEGSPLLTSNHYLADIAGLVFLGILFPELKGADIWKKKGIEALEEEMVKQVYDDGVNFESSTSYHRLVLEFFSYSAILCKYNNIKLSGNFWNKLNKMFTYVAYYTKPNGLAPQISDNDDGRFFIFANYYNWEKRDHRYLINIGATLFPENKIINSYITDSPEAFWITSKLKNENFNNYSPFKLQTKAFPKAGIYILRSDKIYCYADIGQLGQNEGGGHDHNDLFGFELNYNGEDFIIDPGSYLYTSDHKNRNLFRSVKMHNTLNVDNQEVYIPTPGSVFGLQKTAKINLIKWQSDNSHDHLEASHDGYNGSYAPIIHSRSFDLNKYDNILSITDKLAGNGPHTFEWNFVLDPEVEINHISTSSLVLKKKSIKLQMKIDQSLSIEIKNCFTSPSYGIKIPTKKITLTKKNENAEIDKTYTFIFRKIN